MMNNEGMWKAMAAMNDVMPMWSDELLGKLLAWATATGFLECTTQEPMHAVLMIAAKRFKIEGGEVPNMERIAAFYYPRLRELQRLKADTPWLPALMERYHLTDWRTLDYGCADDIVTALDKPTTNQTTRKKKEQR